MAYKVENPFVPFVFDDRDYVPEDFVSAPNPRLHSQRLALAETPYPSTPQNADTVKSHRTHIDPLSKTRITEYTMQSKCGEGGYGKVYSAWHNRQLVAIKFFKTTDDDPKQKQAKKEHEMLSASKGLPNVLQLLRWGNNFNGQYFIVTELHQSIQIDPCDLLGVQRISRGLFKGLDELHRRGIIHGDIKPTNCLVNAQKEGVIADLGNATYYDEKRGPHLQTVWYRDPRVFIDAPYDHTIDLWGMGCTLFKLAVGKTLFPGCTHETLRDPTHTQELHTLHLITKLLGVPSNTLLRIGTRNCHYFTAALELRKLPKRVKFAEKGPDYNTLRASCMKAGQDETLTNHLVSLIGRLVTYGEKISAARALDSPFLAQIERG